MTIEKSKNFFATSFGVNELFWKDAKLRIWLLESLDISLFFLSEY